MTVTPETIYSSHSDYLMDCLTPREEVDYALLYKTFLTRESILPVICYDSRELHETAPRCRLPFPPEKSGFSWNVRLERAREEIPRTIFKVTRSKILKLTSVSKSSLEIPIKRGRGRPKKDNFDASNESLESVSEDQYGLDEIGVAMPERHYFRRQIKGKKCEYDLDFQDVEWLKLTKERHLIIEPVSEGLMEKIIEELELGWDALTKPLKKLQQRKEAAMYPDEVPCEICGESDTSNCNVIVLCDDCDLAVHQECYGIPHIPEGPWLCRHCTEGKISGISRKGQCILCPWPGGALRKTSDHRWVHSLCAHLVPETAGTFNPSSPYDLVDVCTLNAERAKLRCVLCRSDPKGAFGYPIQCNSKLCSVAFHPMCARAADWPVNYTNQKAYCCKHIPDTEIVSIDSDGEGNENRSEDESRLKLRINMMSTSSGFLSPTKSSQKYPVVTIGESCPLHFTRGGEKLRIPTFAPKVLIEHIAKVVRGFADFSRLSTEDRMSVVRRIAKYWSLKRESRRGTPLLKSLQLDAGWSQTDSISEEAFESEWQQKVALVKYLKCLKGILKALRLRERTKFEASAASEKIFERLSSPFTHILEAVVRKLRDEIDSEGFFSNPVPVDLFPDYPLVIKHPMDFATLLHNLRADRDESRTADQLFYPTILHFYADLKLIWENCRLYNMETSVFFRAANTLEKSSKHLLSMVVENFNVFGIKQPFDILTFAKQKRLDIDWNDSDLEIPECSHVRFPQLFPPNKLTFETASYEVKPSVNENSGSKRRGRPPKRHFDGGSFSSSSIESISSDGSSNSSVSSTESQKRKRGRPPKPNKPKHHPIEEEAEDEDEEIFQSSNQKVEMKNLFWVRMRNGNWCPGQEISEERPARRGEEGMKTFRLFDAFKTVLKVGTTSIRPLTKDFEADYAGLAISGIASKKWLSSAHRNAFSSVKQ